MKLLRKLLEEMGILGNPQPSACAFFIMRKLYSAPEKGQKFTKQLIKFFLLTFTIGLPLITGLMGHLIKANKDFMFIVRLESVTMATETLCLIYTGASCICLGNKYVALLERLTSKKYGRPKKLLEEIKMHNKLTLLIYSCSTLLCVFHCFYTSYFQLYCDGRNILKDNKYVCGQPVTAWYPFEVDSKLVEWIITIWNMMALIVGGPNLIMGAVMGIEIPRLIMIRIEDLKNEVKELKEFKGEETRQIIRYFLEYYWDILGCIHDMMNTLGYTMVFEYVLMTAMIALSEYEMFATRNYVEGLRLAFTLSLQATFCLFSQAMKNEHEALVDAVYNIPWYDFTADMRLNFLLFHGQVLQPVNVRIPPLVNIDHCFLLTVLKGTYSIFMCLLRYSK